ncbi:1-aminocyclopropane-1-carboxylate deaminase/D-cysteine desulfhydrase [Rhizosphaericola mali]|uniref:Pyridoxal-phosphate dependent enzyme n=1 Tax=Rhizosphaericola mali TaxID=2545455 RepID=A0A5P2G3P3_9BACT|nr:pyridoxal-phosphate dependent enzyme [Rhizosphaericola mali]QES89358.1 pyridoxal-phosphate dependent enzyme [Rhizosphaericola mali]
MDELLKYLQWGKVDIQSIVIDGYEIDVLRLDKLDPLISGNKWFKLKYFLSEYFLSNKNVFATFGGAYSNHIAATARAGKELGITTVGCIRGEKPKKYSPTLLQAEKDGMQFQFVSRENYQNKEEIVDAFPEYYWVPEGGFGSIGAKGAQDIWQFLPQNESYTDIFLAMGTGTTVAGIVNGSPSLGKVHAVNVLKNNYSINDELASMLHQNKSQNLVIENEFHFGGYAKKTPELLAFINKIYEDFQLPLDFVYTGKAFYALFTYCLKKQFSNGSKILFIHTGGLQGNNSLSKDVLKF